LLLQYAGYDVPLSVEEINNVFPTKVRAKIVADNPVAACRFFDTYIKATIKHLFGYQNVEGGIFGHIYAYHGVIGECERCAGFSGRSW
jgi:hypothetical protein